ncbi:MAG: HAMP domain-containing histidine kinase [Deltaproteobacteria bacterium]|nr:HAMP domain-containing histidine kinase [Deltaproteobacteria bacterium]
MDPAKIPTQFASAERSSDEEIKHHIELFSNKPFLNDFLNTVPDIVMVLNKNRQIVYSNQILLKFLGANDLGFVCGRRPGEAFNCIHSDETEGGCGTTEFCKTCGAVKAILACQKGISDIQECRIIRKGTGDALDLRVWTRPLKEGDELFTIFSVTDISDEKRRRALERIFFHDVLNTAVGLRGFSQLLEDATADDMAGYQKIINQLSECIIDEINAQRQLTAAENDELVVDLISVNSLDILQELMVIYMNHQVAEGRHLSIDPKSIGVVFTSDRTLLKRVIGNMTKNALEAAKDGETVTIGCETRDDEIQFWVHNPRVMPEETQLQMFQRSFSTKGAGRGLGTYSMKLLTERYLKGTVSFTSAPGSGTVFRACYPLIFDQETIPSDSSKAC